MRLDFGNLSSFVEILTFNTKFKWVPMVRFCTVETQPPYFLAGYHMLVSELIYHTYKRSYDTFVASECF